MFRTRLPKGRRHTRSLLLSLLSLSLLAIHAGGLARAAARTSQGVMTVGLYQTAVGVFHLRNSNTQGPADLRIRYGPSPPELTCNQPAPYYCTAGWFPVAGDWDGDGIDTIGLYRHPSGTFYLKNSNTEGPADVTFPYGAAAAGWLPLAGDWDGDGVDTVGLYDPSAGYFYLKNTNAAGPADITFQYGVAGDDWLPMAGDWDGNGLDNVGLYDPHTATYFLKNTNHSGPADFQFEWRAAFAGLGGFPLGGDWDADGTDTAGFYYPGAGTVYLKNSNAAGPTEITFNYGPASTYFMPVTGDWDGL